MAMESLIAQHSAGGYAEVPRSFSLRLLVWRAVVCSFASPLVTLARVPSSARLLNVSFLRVLWFGASCSLLFYFNLSSFARVLCCTRLPVLVLRFVLCAFASLLQLGSCAVLFSFARVQVVCFTPLALWSGPVLLRNTVHLLLRWDVQVVQRSSTLLFLAPLFDQFQYYVFFCSLQLRT